MNSREKGNKSERKCVKELEKEGWLVYRVKGSTKFNKNVDIFGLFDILAIKRKYGLQKRKWIQVKTNQKLYGKKLKPFLNFKYRYCCGGDEVEIWTWVDRKGWSIECF